MTDIATWWRLLRPFRPDALAAACARAGLPPRSQADRPALIGDLIGWSADTGAAALDVLRLFDTDALRAACPVPAPHDREPLLRAFASFFGFAGSDDGPEPEPDPEDAAARATEAVLSALVSRMPPEVLRSACRNAGLTADHPPDELAAGLVGWAVFHEVAIEAFVSLFDAHEVRRRCCEEHPHESAADVVRHLQRRIDRYSGRRREPTLPPPPRRPSVQDDPWAVLGVSPGASAAEIREAYIKRCLEYHPDRVATLGEKLRLLAEEETKRINVAYEALRRRVG